MGVAVSAQSLKGKEGKFILEHFNSITAENAMKMGPIHPLQNKYNWRDADSIVSFAQKNKIKVRGHNLCWHEQTPRWLLVPPTEANPDQGFPAKTPLGRGARWRLAFPRRHPDGLTQIRLGYLMDWNHSIVSNCMVMLEQAGRVRVTGGTARRPKVYTVLPADALLQPSSTSPKLPQLQFRSQMRQQKDAPGELRAPQKLLASLSSKTAKALQHRGNYTPREANRLFELLRAGSWL